MLHVATLSGVLACLMRHFRASLASLPLLGQVGWVGCGMKHHRARLEEGITHP